MGKPVFSDLREGKLTLPLLTLLERAPADTRPIIERIWAAGEATPIRPEDERALRNLLAQHDALAETRDLARQAAAAATAALTGLEGDRATKKILLEIPDFLLNRSS
jgi:geranylgeranyl pyrophosphate synthase